MNEFQFRDGASWIWSALADRPYNNVVLFRRSFDVAASSDACLFLTADSRYEVYVNGRWLGFGPPRAWPSPWPVDVYDLSPYLTPGLNTIAILVQHWGMSTFQYLHGKPGLLAELRIGDERIVSDTSWRCIPSAAHGWPVPRLSCMQPWEEQFDARLLPSDWNLPGFDDSTWPAATITCRAGEGEHASFERRDIPMLSDDAVAPTRVLAVEAVQPAAYVWTLYPIDLLNPHDKSANYTRGRVLLLTQIYSEAQQKIELHLPHHRPATMWKLNGALLEFDDLTLQQTDTGVAHAMLNPGWNTLLCRMPHIAHYWWAVISVRTEHPIRTAAFNDDRPAPTPWLAMGPFGSAADIVPLDSGMSEAVIDAAEFPPGATADLFESIWARGIPSDSELELPYTRSLTPDMVAIDDVYARCASERVVAQSNPHVDQSESLQTDSADWTTIYPSADFDTRILLDFGGEVVGFHESELDAPAGVVVDIHNFEFIQPDGRFNLAEGMNNSFRYICREGRQRYRTLIRRGFRYSWLSFRGGDRPIKVRFVRVRMSTYPQTRRGSFACSDPLLNDIWEAGAHSVACCSEDTFTDCPTYEQTFWVGDGRNEALVDLVANGDPRLSARSLRIAGQSLQRSPIIESQVPSGWHNILPAWSFLWMRWAQEHFMLTGDIDFGRELVAMIDQNVDGIERHLNLQGLFQMRAWNMFDWAAMDTPSDGVVTHLQCLAVLALRQVAALARDVDRPVMAGRWSSLADRIAVATNAHMWDESRQAYIDCIRGDGSHSPVFSQQTQTAAYISGVAADARATRCGQIMHAAPDGFVTAGSPFFMFFLLEGLVREGKFDQLAATIRDYWGPQIEAGATTFWEMYHRNELRMTRSHCHGWSAGPTYFLTQYILGVTPATPGYGRIRIDPRAVNLQWARGNIPTPHGTVSCQWRRQGSLLAGQLRLPSNLEVEITVSPEVVCQIQRGSCTNTYDGRAIVRGREIEFTLFQRNPNQQN